MINCQTLQFVKSIFTLLCWQALAYLCACWSDIAPHVQLDPSVQMLARLWSEPSCMAGRGRTTEQVRTCKHAYDIIMITFARGVSVAKEYVQVCSSTRASKVFKFPSMFPHLTYIQDCAQNFQEGAHKELMGVARSHFLCANLRKLGSSLWSLSS